MTVEETKRLIKNIYDRVIENAVDDELGSLPARTEINERTYFSRVVKNCIKQLKHYREVVNKDNKGGTNGG